MPGAPVYTDQMEKFEVQWLKERLQEAGDEWLANNARVEVLSKVLPRPALEIVARELGVKYWELNN